MARYFVIRGFGKKQDSVGTEFDFDRIDRELIAPALARCQFEGGTTGEINDSGSIHEDMFALILEADVVVCDITVCNANVFYELGVRHALRKTRTVLIKGEPSADKTPFDIGGFRYLGYPATDPGKAVDALESSIRAGQLSDRETDSPVFRFLLGLPEAPQSLALPVDFLEEVQRARAARDKGWLAMLAQDVQRLRFGRNGLREVARAQFEIRDLEAARCNWETLRKSDPQNIEALFTLANIYERKFRDRGDPELLKRSDQALNVVLARNVLDAKDRAEALGQRARNLKTRWRQPLGADMPIADRRALACDRLLLDCFDHYHKAYVHDLNSFYTGLAALQVGVTLKSLQSEPQWHDMFDDERQEQSRRDELDDLLPRLAHTVQVSIERTLSLDAVSEGEKQWARVSRADMKFLCDEEAKLVAKPGSLVSAYRLAVPEPETFHWESVTGQLDLFASLGIRAVAARAVIDALKPRSPPAVKRQLLVVFAGHSIDEPQRAVPRLPAAAEARARELIRGQLLTHQGVDVQVLASSAPGADILVHEVCAELGIPTVLCLPMPVEYVVQHAYGCLDGWRNRLLDIVRRQGTKIRILQSEAGLPRWLAQSVIDPWDRGNRWMMAMAESWPADEHMLLALWDREESAGRIGGTTQIVELARRTPNFKVEIIDSRTLLG